MKQTVRIADLVPGEPCALVGAVERLQREFARKGRFADPPTVCVVDGMNVVSEGNNRVTAAKSSGAMEIEVDIQPFRDAAHEASLRKVSSYCVQRGYAGFDSYPVGSKADRLAFYL